MSAPCEEWLRGDDDERFAAAMMRCRHAGAFCTADGFCHFRASTDDGLNSCFRRQRRTGVPALFIGETTR
jgi:hypothetical protein